MDSRGKAISSRERGAALIIVLVFVVLLTGLVLAYFSRATSDRPVAHSSFNQSKADLLAASAMDNIIGDLRAEIANGSASPAPTFGSSTLYTPTNNANIVPMCSPTPTPGTTPAIPNLIRRSARLDPAPPTKWPDSTLGPAVGSRASGVNSTTDISANGRSISLARWNSHYLVPKSTIGDDKSDPITTGFSGPNFWAPDWVFVTNQGATILTSPNSSVTGRYAYAIYDESGLMDMNVAGYPTGTTAIQSGRKGSIAFADLTALGQYPLPNSSSPFQVDRLVGWRNYGVTQPTNNFPDTNPASQAFAKNFQTSASPATAFYNYVTNTGPPTAYYNCLNNNTNGFLSTTGALAINGRTDQLFLSRQELIAFQKTQNTNNGNPFANTSQFDPNALQYLTTFSRATNSPSFSPSTPAGSTIDYAFLASPASPNEATAVNPNFLRRRVQGTATAVFTRFDNTPANGGEPLVKARFPLSRLAWITYKGPSAVVYAANNSDPAITQLTAAGVTTSTIQAGTAANIKKCFGLVWDSRAYVPASGTTPSVGQQWVYISPNSSNTGGTFDPVSNASGNPASDIKRLDIVASENREPDFFELLHATILDGSLGQNTGGGVTGGATVFPDVHMSNKSHHILSIGAAILDQADPDSIPTRIQFKPSTATTWWTAYGVENLPYITQIYPISGMVTASSTQWSTYLLFQLANPHNGPALSPAAPQVRLRIDGDVGIFTSGNGQAYNPASDPRVSIPATGVSVALTTGVFAPSSAPAPLGTANATAGAAGTAVAPCGFERLPGSLTSYIGLRLLPDYTLAGAPAGGQNPRVTLYFGADSTHRFNATMEYNAGGTTWVPYDHFIGINDPTSRINGATVPVRTASILAGTPNSGVDQFNASRLTQNPPSSFMKADPRATRFGIFQLDTNLTTNPRITDPLWPSGNFAVPNGYGGAIADGSPAVPGNPLEHVPLRFASAAYYPATFCINDGQPNSVRNTITTNYPDNDGIIRPGDAAYPDPTKATTGSSTPWSSYTVSGTTFRPYWPIIINRPFRSVAELGYAFRDLPWKSLDFFSDKSADAGLLDVFCIADGAPVLDGSNNVIGMAEPPVVAGSVNLNTRQAPPLQAILAGTIWDELNSSNSYPKATATPDSAQTMAPLVVSATSTPALNKSELVARAGMANQILPVYSGATANQTDQLVKAQREAVPRALASVTQTRTWNLMIDVVAQSGRYPPTATTAADLPKFIVEGEQHYWVHVAIDRFTGQVIDKQIEVVKE
jgi:hypothetical protein